MFGTPNLFGPMPNLLQGLDGGGGIGSTQNLMLGSGALGGSPGKSMPSLGTGFAPLAAPAAAVPRTNNSYTQGACGQMGMQYNSLAASQPVQPTPTAAYGISE